MSTDVPKKTKILLLSDMILSTSGVGTQGRFLVDRLIGTGKYSFLCFGGAVKHESYEVMRVSPDLTIVPTDGFGNRDMLRLALAQEKPDALMIFNDPRFFMWVWAMEEEIHQICPIVYWHLWDQCEMKPTYNNVLYESTDLINCINWPTYEMVKEILPERTNWTPHGIPKGVYGPIPPADVLKFKRQALPGKPDDAFVGLWVNRNAHRKRPGDVLVSWSLFLDKLQAKHGHRKANLIMHTDPNDIEGPNLFKIVEYLNLKDEVSFSINRLPFQDMNVFYNIADFTINLSSAEGFGLPTLEAAYTGTPMVVAKTGGLTRQVIDHRDGTENGIGLDADLKHVVGSQHTPFIVEDHVSHEAAADAFMKMYELGPEGRAALGAKAKAYVEAEFDHDTMVKTWDESLQATISKFKKGESYVSWAGGEL